MIRIRRGNRRRRRPPVDPVTKRWRGRRRPGRLRTALLLLGLVPLFVIGRDFGRWVRAGDLLRLAEVEVTGLERIDRGELDALDVLVPGMPIVDVDPAALGTELGKHPWVRRAFVSRVLPDRVVVRIEERRPRALVLADNRLIEIDEEGVLLPPRGEPGDLPLVTGLKLPDPIPWGEPRPEEPWNVAAVFLDEFWALAERERPGLAVSELHVDEGASELVLVQEGGQRILFGMSALGARIPELFLVLAELDRRALSAKTIDLRFRDQVVVGGVFPRHAKLGSLPQGGDQG